MALKPASISLIGMPGAGKSTVGVLLAKLAGLGFIDTDLAIQQHEQASLQWILETQGYQRLRDIEAQRLARVALEGLVIATGGSAVYCKNSMQRLASAGPIVYLQADLATLEARIQSQPLRGIASPKGQSLAQIYAERTPLYESCAGITISAGASSAQQLAEEIYRQVSI